jgi:hypothetical protein
MTLLSVIKDVCATVGVAVPQSIFSNITGNRTMQEMVALANEMAQRIAYDQRDWTALTTATEIPGNGAASFPLPANFKRMMLNTNVYRLSSPAQPMRFIPEYNEWIDRQLNEASDSSYGEWIIIGGSIYVQPIVAKNTLPVWFNSSSYQTIGYAVYDELDETSWKVAVKHVSAPSGMTFADDRAAHPSYWTSTPNVPDRIHFTYIDKNCVNLASGGRGDVFMADLDSFVLDERVLKLAMIWQWKAQKGSPYAEDMGTYGDALTKAMGNDKPSPIYIGRKPISASAKTAIPTQTIYFPGSVP